MAQSADMEDGGPSVTARRVAAHRLGFARVAADYGDPAADEALAADVAAGRAVPANRMHDYLAARTSFFDRTGWRIMTGGEETAARRERLRSAGLLMASAGPRAPQASARSRPSKPPTPAVRSAPWPGPFSLSALLSQALVAFTIEFDNEAEHRLPHRTTNYGASGHGDGAWPVSLAMWETCMRHVTDEPISVGELETRARTGTNLDGMRRWGYITIDGTDRKIHKGRPGPDAVLRATARGLRAREVWLPLPGLVEQRWRERFGAGQAGQLRDALIAVVSQLDPGLPDCLPILGPALLTRGPDPALPPRPDSAGPAALPLSALLSRGLLSFAIEYEREVGLSLAASANVLRVLAADGTRQRDLPMLTGTSKEAVSSPTAVSSQTGPGQVGYMAGPLPADPRWRPRPRRHWRFAP